jgi:hypothetical protein
MEKIHPNLTSAMNLLKFLEKKAYEIPNERNLHRLNVIEDIFKGLKSREITEKYGYTCKQPCEYLHKFLTRCCEYAGLEINLNLKKMRSAGNFLRNYQM